MSSLARSCRVVAGREAGSARRGCLPVEERVEVLHTCRPPTRRSPRWVVLGTSTKVPATRLATDAEGRVPCPISWVQTNRRCWGRRRLLGADSLCWQCIVFTSPRLTNSTNALTSSTRRDEVRRATRPSHDAALDHSETTVRPRSPGSSGDPAPWGRDVGARRLATKAPGRGPRGFFRARFAPSHTRYPHDLRLSIVRRPRACLMRSGSATTGSIGR